MNPTRPPSPIDAFRRATAKRLRANQTESERKLWKALRELPLVGSHFRRQVPIGRYVADVACLAAKLIVEIDGSQHGDDKNVAHDAERTRWLEGEGYRVLRFWNSDVAENPDGVLDAIYAAIHGVIDAESGTLKHERKRALNRAATPPRNRRAVRADFDPPPPGEGERR